MNYYGLIVIGGRLYRIARIAPTTVRMIWGTPLAGAWISPTHGPHIVCRDGLHAAQDCYLRQSRYEDRAPVASVPVLSIGAIQRGECANSPDVIGRDSV